MFDASELGDEATGDLVDLPPAAELGGEATDGLVDLPPDEWEEVALEDSSSDAPGLDETPQLYFADVDVFVREYLAPTYCRSLEGSQRTWCPEWWRHAEAINRLESLWRAWEHLRLDPATGMSVWWRDHADHHMAALLAPDGPFKGCGSDRGHQPRSLPLPVAAAPPGLFERPTRREARACSHALARARASTVSGAEMCSSG